eukprot:TRINITY_DN7445_c0_g1_i1.p1 TRINITY_DN7445_c0_g1~~TRINITY_DN7445_c0_g1_i1.p1  ORF type:complete len:239 (+),score=63.15 TRINITY_DN7445_c0_g1_i1:90-719(+)
MDNTNPSLPSLFNSKKKKKRVRFVFDTSASMYHFNYADGRLDRALESAVMIMESFKDYADRIDYAISGHSGDSSFIPFTAYGKPPVDRKQIATVMSEMVTHTQFTMRGDNTLPAIREAIKDVAKEPADDHFVIVLSDAHLGQYDISAEDINKEMMMHSNVKTYLIFISNGDRSLKELQKKLLPGSSFLCFSSQSLPNIFQSIISSSIFK